ncbi:hypothetical protein [Mucilaginibacter celer]|uniref:Outer membrane protein beta-barrel domain-containing protein n=1 Tax=Mucilaginibacter celer TaxID=2305508 RepID=A0A494VS25_9SPHI|nr:hypothetical protein [Mucilaginibacter celer]AYL94143.1 hypothetical protein HYN43_002010 [Mucilaginibacter celer]
MNRYYQLFLLFVLLPFFSFAQSHFKPGYVITTGGQTVQGFIDERDWDNNPTSISFKTSASATDTKSYTVDNISYFEVTGSVAFQRYSGAISMDETDINKLSTGKDTSTKQATVFLRLQQKGDKVSLFSYSDDIKTRYFIADNQAGTTVELIYRIYRTGEAAGVNGTNTRSENQYVPQLYSLATKYNPSSSKLGVLIEKAEYKPGDLKSISQLINNQTVDNDSYGSHAGMDFFVGAGVDASTYKFTGAAVFYNDVPNKTSFAPVFIAGVNFYTNKDIGRFIFRTEVLYTSSSYNTIVDVYFNQPDKPKATYRLKQHEIGIAPQVLYYFYNTANVKAYAGIGLMLNLTSYGGNNITNNADPTSVRTNILVLDTRWLSYPIKAGVLLNKNIEVALAYSLPVSITNIAATNTANYSLNLSSFKAGVNYHF